MFEEDAATGVHLDRRVKGVAEERWRGDEIGKVERSLVSEVGREKEWKGAAMAIEAVRRLVEMRSVWQIDTRLSF